MSIWDTVAAPIIAIINKVVPDKTAAAAAIANLQQMQMQGQLEDEFIRLQAVTTAQSDIDKVEAGSSNWFVAGWRPAIGWVCCAAFGFEFLLRPLLQWGLAIAGHSVPLPSLDATLTQLTYAMLGMGTISLGAQHPMFKGSK
jgi:hypothetical protein